MIPVARFFWPNGPLPNYEYLCSDGEGEIDIPGPELPAEVHKTTPFNAEKAWAATVALCKSEG
jgi:hypothetical protein